MNPIKLCFLLSIYFFSVHGDENCAFEDTFTCTNRANNVLKEEVQKTEDTNEIQAAICLNMEEQYSCYDQSSYRCLNTDQDTKDRLLSYQEYVQPLLNGRVYRSCMSGRYPPWRFMQQITGSTKCDYVEYHTDLLPKMQNCIHTNLAAQTARIDAINETAIEDPQTFYSDLACESYVAVYANCRDGIRGKCFTERMAQQTKAIEDRNYFDNYVFQVQTVHPEFTFEGDCSTSEGI